MRRDRVLGIVMMLAMLTACAGQGQQPPGEIGAATATSGRDTEHQAGTSGVQTTTGQSRGQSRPARDPGQPEQGGTQSDQDRQQGAGQAAEEASRAVGSESRERQPRAGEAARRQEQERERALARARQEREQAERERREALERERARKEQRIAELEQQIEQNDAEVARIDEANRVLRQALDAAERLNAALSEEQQKYSRIDPETGELLEPLDPARIESLREEKLRLERQARELMAETTP